MEPIEELSLLLKAAARESERQANDLLRQINLTNPQAEALDLIARLGPLSLGELGGLIVAEGGQPSRLVDRLVSRGLVDRRDAPGNRRRLELLATQEGARLAREAKELKKSLVARATAAMRGHDVEPLKHALSAFLADTPLGQTVENRVAAEQRERAESRG